MEFNLRQHQDHNLRASGRRIFDVAEPGVDDPSLYKRLLT